MALVFPNSPTPGQTTYTGGRIWTYTGSGWTTPTSLVTGGNLLSVATNILPNANVTLDIGSDLLRWRDIYLSGNTIDLGGTAIKNTANGVSLTSAANAQNAVPITVSSIQLSSAGNVVSIVPGSSGLTTVINGNVVPISGGGASVTVSNSAPTTPNSGSLWLNSETGVMSAYYGGQWADFITASTNGVTISNAAPSSADAGAFWLDTETGDLSIYYGNLWIGVNEYTGGTQGATGATGVGANLLAVSTSVVPNANITYDLGTSSLRWRDLYLSGNTIDLGGKQVKGGANGIEFRDSTNALIDVLVNQITVGTGANAVVLKGSTTGLVQTTSANVTGAAGGTSLTIGNVTYPGSALAASTAGGDTITVSGSGFAANAKIYIDKTEVNTAVVTTTSLTFTAPSNTDGLYHLFVYNTDGSNGVKPIGMRYSTPPLWATSNTLPTAGNNTFYSQQLQTNSSLVVTYSITAGALPTNLTLAANGLISGNTAANANTYTFTVRALDSLLLSNNRVFSLTVSNAISLEYLVVAGGGGGSIDVFGRAYGGGGGGGGYLTAANVQVNLGTAYTVTVGGGGAAGAASPNTGSSGTNSVFNTIIAIGGGGGGFGGTDGVQRTGLEGGSGGGAGWPGGAGSASGGPGTPGQGYGGGPGNHSPGVNAGGGGGGGASAASSSRSGAAGITSSITNTSVIYGGGGSAGGDGGGGTPAGGGGAVGASPSANTGGGGGSAAAGGSGIVVLKIAATNSATFSAGLTSSLITAVAGFKIYSITAGTGTVTFS